MDNYGGDTGQLDWKIISVTWLKNNIYIHITLSTLGTIS